MAWLGWKAHIPSSCMHGVAIRTTPQVRRQTACLWHFRLECASALRAGREYLDGQFQHSAVLTSKTHLTRQVYRNNRTCFATSFFCERCRQSVYTKLDSVALSMQHHAKQLPKEPSTCSDTIRQGCKLFYQALATWESLKSLRLSPPTQRRTNRESLNPKP